MVFKTKLRKRVLIVHGIQRWGINTLTKCIIMYVSGTKCILAPVFAFSAFLGCILPLCRLRYTYISVAVICGKTAVTWFAASTNQRRSAFSIPHFTFCIPHSAIPHFTNTLGLVIERSLVLLPARALSSHRSRSTRFTYPSAVGKSSTGLYGWG